MVINNDLKTLNRTTPTILHIFDPLCMWRRLCFNYCIYIQVKLSYEQWLLFIGRTYILQWVPKMLTMSIHVHWGLCALDTACLHNGQTNFANWQWVYLCEICPLGKKNTISTFNNLIILYNYNGYIGHRRHNGHIRHIERPSCPIDVQCFYCVYRGPCVHCPLGPLLILYFVDS